MTARSIALMIALALAASGCSVGGSGSGGSGGGGTDVRSAPEVEVEPGQTVAYLDDGDLYVAVPGDEPVQLTDAEGAVSALAFSPDAARLAYAQERPGECCNEVDEEDYVCCPDVRVIELATGRDTVFERDVDIAGLAWEAGDDEPTLVTEHENTQTEQDPATAPPVYAAPNDSYQLVLFGPDHEQLEGVILEDPFWSEDETRGVVTRYLDGNAAVVELADERGELTRVGVLEPGTMIFDHAWAANRRAAFVAGARPGESGPERALFVVDAEQPGMERVVEEMPVTLHLEWSPAGDRLLAIVGDDGDGRSLVSIDVESGTLDELAELAPQGDSVKITYTDLAVAPRG